LEGHDGGSVGRSGLKEFIDNDIPKPVDAQNLAKWIKCVAKARRIILEGV